ncbi:hypothetical protein [Endozoicomonas sp. SESOKO1]|uniref:hypothetical protein n=1 Tax=Endozoicomonas sp. SESOKO1 TaxID=2828742 RepID=UPI002147F92C|nr:hypothetical protein [Endozoicomonas sp. SESOKO1]
MDQVANHSQNSSTDSVKLVVTEKAPANGNASGRTVSPVSGQSLGVNPTPHPTTHPATGQKKQKETGISSRAIALDVDTCAATKRKPKFKKPETIQGTNTAIFNDKQVKLIQGLLNGKTDRLKVDAFIDIIDFLGDHSEVKLPKGYARSPTLLSGIIRNYLWEVFERQTGGKLMTVLSATPEREKQLFLVDARATGSVCGYLGLPEALRGDIDFLTEYSSLYGIPHDTPAKLAVPVYERLDIGAKIKSINVLPDNFKDDAFYDELIRSGRVPVKDLPLETQKKNEAYCFAQLSDGLCRLSDFPDQLITKKTILASLYDENLHNNFIHIIEDDHKYKLLTSDPDFFEEVLLKTNLSALELRISHNGSHIYPLSDVYKCCMENCQSDRGKLALLLKKLVKANPFFVISIEDSDDVLMQELIETGKNSLLEILTRRPELIQYFRASILFLFFNTVNADDDFKNHVMDIVYPYFPVEYSEYFPEEILHKQDAIVLESEPSYAGEHHIVVRKLRPGKAGLIIDYIERFPLFLRRFNNKAYLEKCCTDPTIRQRLIQVLACRIIANKRQLMTEWVTCVPRQIIDETLAYLNNPDLFLKLDVSGTLTKPVNPLYFQRPNPSALPLTVAAHATGFHPADIASNRQLQSEFARASKIKFQPFYPGQQQHTLSLFKGKGSVVGGRTLAVGNGKRVDYYKFQRLGESVATLAQEGIMHQFIARALNNRFKSELPRFGQYLIILAKDLPGSVRGFTDRLQMITMNGERAFRVYHFKATKNYGKYAHTPDGTSTPYALPERGLLNAIHDIGVLNGSVGVMPTSTIPVFHDTGRRWVFLSPLLGNSEYFAFPLPGTFENWMNAIERPDFGWDGLRDWGDVEFYGSMSSGLSARDSKTSGYTPEVMQRLSFANAICENLLAAVLLRSRLRRDSPDYHYQNQQAVEATEDFIEQLLNEYLSGLSAREKEWPPRPRLQEFMGLDQETYHSWLKRTAREILYWTAVQPYEAADHCAWATVVECYSEHINNTGNLDTTLYPVLRPFDLHRKFPYDFASINGQLNLGADSAVFPLVALVKGFTLLAAKILAISNN